MAEAPELKGLGCFLCGGAVKETDALGFAIVIQPMPDWSQSNEKNRIMLWVHGPCLVETHRTWGDLLPRG